MSYIPGDKVIVTEYPERPVGVIVRRCRTDNRFLFVDVEGRGKGIRIRERSLEKGGFNGREGSETEEVSM